MHTLTGTEDMTHGYWWYDSQVMHILTGNAYSLYRVNTFHYLTCALLADFYPHLVSFYPHLENLTPVLKIPETQ